MDWFDGIKDTFSSIADSVIEVLPKSPIVYLESNPEIEKVMGYVNFFIPIYSFIALLEGWLIAIMAYYCLMTILRWAKFIE